ncbi:MAG: hypothetical protein CR984_03470 [Proteobacteria bacterium]|nr:MAG: hypothetical protein CR984_03470 [Pseudomonadota bacterium]
MIGCFFYACISIAAVLVRNEEYLKSQLITYLGNKRKLLPLIEKAILSTDVKTGSFLDLFAGSGVVSRLARLMGFQVTANDWEDFSCIISRAFLGLDRESLPGLLGSVKALAELLEHINHLPEPEKDRQYMALYYAPASRDIALANYKKERLFYTRDNALRIDKIRNYIEDYYPAGRSARDDKIRSLLIALLLVEASRHTNTSGVFKAYHKGFGGFGRDALKRILAPIELPFPVLPDKALPARIFFWGSARRRYVSDFCFLDREASSSTWPGWQPRVLPGPRNSLSRLMPLRAKCQVPP